MTTLEEIFGTVTVPNWLLDFYSDPLEAVDAALWGRYYFGNLNVAESSDLLIDWAVGIGDQEDFVRHLDDALTQWIEGNWGKQPEVQGMKSATATALAWMQLGEIVANVAELKKAGQALRERFEDRQAYLGPLCQGPSRDPLGSYLYAVARHQEDRLLLPTWWNYCNLVAGIPWYHGIYGIWGLRGLPPLPEERGRMSEPVISALPRLALGLYKRSLERSINLNEAKAEFERIVHLVQLAYPFTDRWSSYWAAEVDVLRREPLEEPLKWMGRFVPALNQPQPTGRRRERRNGLGPASHWPAEAARIAEQLRQNARETIQEAENLIKQQRQYAEKTGNSYYVSRSLTRFARIVSASYPSEAVKWAEEARMWEPWNAYTWTVLTQAVRRDRTRDINEAISIAWETAERFPENVVAPNGLAEVLKAAGRLDEAEAIYRATRKRFPENVVAHTGLAEVLKAAGRLDEAEAIYRATRKRFPENVYARVGLAMLLRLRGKEHLYEALELVNQAIEQNSYSIDTLTEKARILEQLGQMTEAQEVLARVRNAVSSPVSLQRPTEEAKSYISRKEAIAIAAHVRFLRRWARQPDETGKRPDPAQLRADALAMLDQLITAVPYQTKAHAEKALLLLESGQAEEARRFLGDSIRMFPNDSALKYALGRVEREVARLEARRLDAVNPETITTVWQRLRQANPAFRPLESLGSARTWLAYRDGQMVRDQAIKSFSAVRQWTRSYLDFISKERTPDSDAPENIRHQYKEQRGFEQWWSREIQAYLFGPIDINLELQDEHLDVIEQRLKQYTLPIDTLEEDLTARLSF